jgi:hypothetical protein
MLTGPRDDAGLVRDDTRDDVEPNERFLPSPVDAGQKSCSPSRAPRAAPTT